MTKLKELKEYIQKEIPEIIEDFEEQEQITDQVGNFVSQVVRPTGRINTYERPITLEDVLGVIEIKTRPYEWVVSTNGMFSKMIKHCGNPEYVGTGVAWKLGLPLDQQSEETIEFLYDLLIKNK